MDENGNAIDVRDPMAETFAGIAAISDGSAADLADRFLALESIFGTDLPTNPKFKSAVTLQLDQLLSKGARVTIASASLADS